MIWTSDDTACSPGSHVVVVGSQAFYTDASHETIVDNSDIGSECRPDAGTDHEAVRCCADAVLDEREYDNCGVSLTCPCPGFLDCVDGFCIKKQDESCDFFLNPNDMGDPGGW